MLVRTSRKLEIVDGNNILSILRVLEIYAFGIIVLKLSSKIFSLRRQLSSDSALFTSLDDLLLTTTVIEDSTVLSNRSSKVRTRSSKSFYSFECFRSLGEDIAGARGREFFEEDEATCI
jgi:hypothetical protein